ncbi:hypothetical protein [Streptomyces halobius]|uniref:Uncharacterized protein n=1 Tax=Streptomyces halobius TaxID=2879846 RepID=A0ABY4MM80_9ACTN|nr:hypothetical protein [Streptomyces halobius]UQA97526.1 hypothetical protein K9S39_41785 [Streptomyces halobius]
MRKSFFVASFTAAALISLAHTATAAPVTQSGTGIERSTDASASFEARGWVPPAGYFLENKLVGWDEASCRKGGDKGKAQGKWRQYICHEEMVKVADVWVLAQALYVKK